MGWFPSFTSHRVSILVYPRETRDSPHWRSVWRLPHQPEPVSARLLNAPWQEEMIHPRLRPWADLCAYHRQILEELPCEEREGWYTVKVISRWSYAADYHAGIFQLIQESSRRSYAFTHKTLPSRSADIPTSLRIAKLT
jgi:hypothetical protein